MPRLVSVHVYPYGGYAGAPWDEDPEVDCWGRSSLAVSERYSEGLRDLATTRRPLMHWTSEVVIHADQPKGGCPSPSVRFWKGDWMVRTPAPKGLLEVPDGTRQRLCLDSIDGSSQLRV